MFWNLAMKRIVALLIALLVASPSVAQIPLRQSTARTIVIGPLLDRTDGVTAETGLGGNGGNLETSTNLALSKNGGSFAARNSTSDPTHLTGGYYTVPLDTTDTNTLGPLVIKVDDGTTYLPHRIVFYVMLAQQYDSLYPDSGATPDSLQVDSREVGGQTASASGTVTFPNATLASTTNITAGTITTTTNTTNAPSAGDFTSTMKASIQSEVLSAMSWVTGTAQSGTSSTIVLASATSYADDIINGRRIRIKSGTGAGQSRVITDFVGSTDTCSVSPNWVTNPSSDSVYVIDDGSVNIATVSNTAASSTSGPIDANVVEVDGAALGTHQSGHMPSDDRYLIGTARATPDTAGYEKVTIKDGTGTGEIDTAAGTVLLNTSQGAVTFDDLNVTNNVALADGLTITRSSSNSTALSATGSGTGHGFALQGGTGSGASGFVSAAQGAGGYGMFLQGNTSGEGLSANGGASGSGIEGIGGGTSGHGISANAPATGDAFNLTATSGDGIDASGAAGVPIRGNITGNLTGSVSGSVGSVTAGVTLATSQGAITFDDLNVTNNVSLADGLTVARSTSNQSAITVTGNGTGHGFSILGGTGSGASGLIAAAQGSGGYGFFLQGNGAGEGLSATGGATGSGIEAIAGGTSGHALSLSAPGTGDAFHLAATSGDGIDASAVSSVPIRGNITGDVTGTLSTVTTLTNLPTIPSGWLTGTGAAQSFYAKFFTGDSGTTYASAVDGSVVKEIAANASGGGGGSTDWTSTEKSQIRYRLGLDGTTNTPSATPTLALASALATAQADLDILTGTDGVILATDQPNVEEEYVAPDNDGIAAIQSVVESATYGNSALKTALDTKASQTSVDDVPTVAEFNARTTTTAAYATASNQSTILNRIGTPATNLASVIDTNLDAKVSEVEGGGGLTPELETKIDETHTAVTSGTHGNSAIKTAVDTKASQSSLDSAATNAATAATQSTTAATQSTTAATQSTAANTMIGTVNTKIGTPASSVSADIASSRTSIETKIDGIEIEAAGMLTDVNQDPVGAEQLILAIRKAGGLVSDKDRTIGVGASPLMGVDFRNVAPTGRQIINVDDWEIVSGTAGGVTFGDVGRDKQTAKCQVTGVTPGTYRVKVRVTFYGGAIDTCVITLKVAAL